MKKLIMGSLLLLLLLTMTGCRSGENGEVYVYSYGDYYDPEVVADFEADKKYLDEKFSMDSNIRNILSYE